MADFSPKTIATHHVEQNGTQTPHIDGVPLVGADQVLCVAQNDEAQNGLFRISSADPSGVWPRAGTLDTPAKAEPGKTFYVRQGPNAGSLWMLVGNSNPATIGTTPLRFELYLPGPYRSFAGARGKYFAGALRGLHVRMGGVGEVIVGPGGCWIPASGRIVENPADLSKTWSGLQVLAGLSVYAYEGEDGLLDFGLSPDRPAPAGEAPQDSMLVGGISAGGRFLDYTVYVNQAGYPAQAVHSARGRPDQRFEDRMYRDQRC